MGAAWKEQEDSGEFDSRVRARRPELRVKFTNLLTGKGRNGRVILGRSLRLATAVALVATVAAALAAGGAFSYGRTALRQDLKQAKDIVSPGSQTVLSSPADIQYRPGKGCGDKNHIHDRQSECQITINNGTVKEGNFGTIPAVFTVSLDGPAIDTVTVLFATANGTATAPADYLSTAGTVTFNPGESSKTITAFVVGDTIPEPNENFSALLSNASPNAVIANGQGIETIKNDD
jgi:hypothetical protein